MNSNQTKCKSYTAWIFRLDLQRGQETTQRISHLPEKKSTINHSVLNNY